MKQITRAINLCLQLLTQCFNNQQPLTKLSIIRILLISIIKVHIHAPKIINRQNSKMQNKSRHCLNQIRMLTATNRFKINHNYHLLGFKDKSNLLFNLNKLHAFRHIVQFQMKQLNLFLSKLFLKQTKRHFNNHHKIIF